MKNKIYIFRLLCLVLICVLMTGCQDASYEVVMENGSTYLILNNVTDQRESGASVSPGLSFDSVFELRESVISNSLNEQELNHINTYFSKTKDGRIKVIDMNAPQEPMFPQGIAANGTVTWYGNYFEVPFNAKNASLGSLNGYYTYCTQEVQTKQKNHIYDVEDHFVYSVEYSNDTKITVYSTGITKFKLVVYSLELGDTKFEICEKYRLETTTDLECSDTVPFRIEMYGVTGNHYYMYSFYDLEECPSAEWLSSFGVRDAVADFNQSPT